LAEGWDSLKKEVKEASDIVDVVGAYVALRQVGARYKGLCPFHQDHNPSFDVDPRRQYFRCWSCGKKGDVFDFIQEHERVDFREALELLARRANISLEKMSGRRPGASRSVMLELVGQAAAWYHDCLLRSAAAEPARQYLGERGLNASTVEDFSIGYAPASGDWFASRAAGAGFSTDLLLRIGLIGQRNEGNGYYDRFRDRIMFPIRNPAGQVIGFGGRILPGSAQAERAPKYYNSPESELFHKSEVLYGIDRAKSAAGEGYLAVVEGYTDVLMAHQQGIAAIVSTMGTALNNKHVKQLRRYLPNGRVILVFDADLGGDTGVDRALEIFVTEEVDLAIATLPDGMDPCDLLVQRGPDAFRQALGTAVDALDFKLNRLLSPPASDSIEGRRRAADLVLGVLALVPERPRQSIALKQELVVNRLAQRLRFREETVWARLKELRSQRRPARTSSEKSGAPRAQPAPAHERQLLQALLAEPRLVAEAKREVKPEEIEHPGIRQLLQGLYDLEARGETPDLEGLRGLVASPALMQTARDWQEVAGRSAADRFEWFRQLLAEFGRRRARPKQEELQTRLQSAHDHTEAVELLRRLQEQTVALGRSASPRSTAVPEPGGN
jgi:DNA primase